MASRDFGMVEPPFFILLSICCAWHKLRSQSLFLIRAQMAVTSVSGFEVDDLAEFLLGKEIPGSVVSIFSGRCV